MNDSIIGNLFGNIFRALRFNLRLGNLIYFAIVAGFAAFSYIVRIEAYSARSVGFSRMAAQESNNIPALFINFLLLLALLAFISKILDNSARIRALANEHVPVDPFSMIDMGAVFRFFGILFVAYIALRILDSTLRLYPYQSFRVSIGVLVFLLFFFPLVFLSLLQQESVSAALHPRALARAFNGIGIIRYLLMLIMSGAVFAAMFYFQLYKSDNLMWRAIGYARPGSYFASLPLYMMVFLIYYGYTFLLFFNYHFVAYGYPVEDTSDDDMDEAEQQAIAATLAGKTAMPEKNGEIAKDLPPDFSLLADADTSGMDIGTQKTFALALARADTLLGSNKIDAGLALLAPYADGAHDAAAFFPAYRRIYALKPEYELLQRLAAAAAHGHAPSFELIRPELERIDPATLPADLIYPLAQFAARQQHYPLVLTLTRGFAQHHPDHPQLIDNYLLAARALAKTDHADRAQQLLTQMLSRFAHHEKAAQIRATLNLLQQQR